ncbi:MAG: PorT family protein [Chitinophagaceae bacterium]|nr:PorT family protein [Chitinophagaceae bacterium]MBK7309004.1 PorT family protein [Chitinophagaceae bacterium]MBK9483769.1 PorT family protein [Chitinophagaceae bacterium]
MIKKLFFSIISVLMINSLQAQVSYGIRAGVNFAKWQGDDLQVIEDLLDKTDGYVVTKGKTGWHVGTYVNIPISNTFSFEPGLAYSKKGYSIKGDVQIPVLKILAINAGAQVQQHYIDMPLVLKANVYKGLQVYAGPQVSYLVRSTLNAKLGVLGINIFNRGFGITERFNKVDMGLTGGIGYQFENGLNVQAGYDYGLSKLDKNENYSAYNRVVKVSVGFSF